MTTQASAYQSAMAAVEGAACLHGPRHCGGSEAMVHPECVLAALVASVEVRATLTAVVEAALEAVGDDAGQPVQVFRVPAGGRTPNDGFATIEVGGASEAVDAVLAALTDGLRAPRLSRASVVPRPEEAP